MKHILNTLQSNDSDRFYNKFFKNELPFKGIKNDNNYLDVFSSPFRVEQNNNLKRALLCLSLTMVVMCICDNGIFASEVSVDLKAPMDNMTKDVWSYLKPVKVASVVMGAVFSLVRQSLMPFGIGAGITIAIQYFSQLVEKGAGCLI